MSGRRNDGNVSTQIRCHRSVRSSSANIAPVSINSLACMSPAQAFTDGVAHRFRAAALATREDPETLRGSLLQLVLPSRFVLIDVALLQPFPGRQIQSRRKRDVAPACLTLETGLEIRRHSPAID